MINRKLSLKHSPMGPGDITDFEVDQILKPGVSPKIRTDLESAASKLSWDWRRAGAAEGWRELLSEYESIVHEVRKETVIVGRRKQVVFIDGGGEQCFRYPLLLDALGQLRDALSENENYVAKANIGDAVRGAVAHFNFTGEFNDGRDHAKQMLRDKYIDAKRGTRDGIKAEIATATGQGLRTLDTLIAEIKAERSQNKLFATRLRN